MGEIDVTGHPGVLLVLQQVNPVYSWDELAALVRGPGVWRQAGRHLVRCAVCQDNGPEETACRKGRLLMARVARQPRVGRRPYEPTTARMLFGRRRGSYDGR